MDRLSEISFLNFGEQSISLEQALRYLQSSGKLTPMVTEVIGQHIVAQEIQSRDDLEVSVAEIEAAAQSFRDRQKLSSAEDFEKWLTQQNLAYTAFLARITDALKVGKLKSQVSEQQAIRFFEENQSALDQITLTCIVTTQQELAQHISDRLHSGEVGFDAISQEYAGLMFSPEPQAVVRRGAVRRGQIADELKTAISETALHEVVGPVEMNQQWWLLRVEDISPAKLEGELKQKLEAAFFQSWLGEKIKESSVQMALK